jgi:hypothetical protein
VARLQAAGLHDLVELERELCLVCALAGQQQDPASTNRSNINSLVELKCGVCLVCVLASQNQDPALFESREGCEMQQAARSEPAQYMVAAHACPPKQRM